MYVKWFISLSCNKLVFLITVIRWEHVFQIVDSRKDPLLYRHDATNAGKIPPQNDTKVCDVGVAVNHSSEFFYLRHIWAKLKLKDFL